MEPERRRWLVDGMNLIGSRPDRWWNDRDGAVHRLVGELDRFAAATGEDVTVVFDRRPPDLEPGRHGSVEVAFASRRGRDAADHEIVVMVAPTPTRPASRWSPRTGGWPSGSATWVPRSSPRRGSGAGSTGPWKPTRIGRDRSNACCCMGNLVLIADDDRDIVCFVALNLRLEGFEVVVANDGQDALDMALDVRPSLILLDTMMPRMDGYEVCSRLRDQRPDAQIPVIMLTAKSMDADRSMAYTAGADDWVTKPFDPADLVSKVKDHLRDHEAAS
jgi:CheY-like chemotaxis protein